MSSPNYVRILVNLRKGSSPPVLADFTQCVLSYFGIDSGQGKIHAELSNNVLTLSDTPLGKHDEVVIKHPTFCPALHLTPELIDKLPPDIKHRGVDVAACLLLESSDGKIFLSRRALHMRTFPGLWVPPGGHVEEGETLLDAGLRELNEEVGLSISKSDCVGQKINLLALWESMFPPKLCSGNPKRHHVVIYFHAKLRQELTAERMESRTKIDRTEVMSCAWLDKDVVCAIAESSEEEDRDVDIETEHLPQWFKALVVKSDGRQEVEMLSTAPLFSRYQDDAEVSERVSTGTKFSLQQLLNISPQSTG